MHEIYSGYACSFQLDVGIEADYKSFRRIQIEFRNTSPPRSNQPSGMRSLLLKNSRLLGRRSGIPQNMPCMKTLSRMVSQRSESIIQSSIRSPVLFLDSVRISFEYMNIDFIVSTVLHPYYKLAYIGLSWGGPKEQAAEIEAGNVNAKDWQDEARKIVEKMVSSSISRLFLLQVIPVLTWYKIDGTIL
jgi:hypothetical protein